MALSKLERRQRIKNRIRKIVSGNSERPRLSVFRSNKEIYAQLIDDNSGATLVAASSRDKEIEATGSKLEMAKLVGKGIAEKAIKIILLLSDPRIPIKQYASRKCYTKRVLQLWKCLIITT